MFDLSAIRAAPVTAVRPPSGSDDSVLTELAGREIRFLPPGVAPQRLPRDSQSLENLWKMVSSDSGEHSHDSWNPAVWTALTASFVRIPLAPVQGADRGFAATALVCLPNRTHVLAIVKVRFAPRQSKFTQPVLATASARVVSDVDQMAEELEDLFLEALPQARSAAQRPATRAIWLGGSGGAATGGDWRSRIDAMGTVAGLRIEVIEEPARHVRRVESNLGSSASAAYLLVWQHMARGAERIIDTFRRLCPDGEVILLDETAFPDVLLEARLALIERGSTERPIRVVDGRRVPSPGEERFYIKTGGSKVGDLLVEVPDCGHNQWGGDTRRRAPRALMGVERLEGVRPAALFHCAKCCKNRWRARF